MTEDWQVGEDAAVLRDIDMRRILKAHLEDAHAGDVDTVIVDELGLRQGAVRVDIAVVNGSLIGYEIKSEVDTLNRLATQVGVYSDVLDEAAIVCTLDRIEQAVTRVPTWWHVLVAETDGAGSHARIHVVRSGTRNPALNVRALVELLWHDEAVSLLRARGEDRGFARKPRRQAWNALVDAYSVDELREAVRARLKRGAEARRADARPS